MCKNKELLIIGAGGHGTVLADIARLNGYTQIQFLDDADVRRTDGYPVVGRAADFVQYLASTDFVVAVGNNDIRAAISQTLTENGAKLATLVHPQAVIGENVTVGEGTVIMAGAVVNPGARIGKGVILNTCCSVDHDCVIRDYAHISVGAHLCGTVSVGRGTFVGAGATVINQVTICAEATVGAGAVVVKNIEVVGTYIGVPARKIK